MKNIYKNPTREILEALPKLPFFYIIQHISTGRYYCGMKVRMPNPATFMIIGPYRKTYITSSAEVKALIKQEGIDTFKIRRIILFNDPRLAHVYEHRYLLRVNARQNKNFINKNNGIPIPAPSGWHHSDEIKAQLSTKFIGENNPFYGKQHTDATKAQLSRALTGKGNPRFGVKLSDDQIKKYSLTVAGYRWWNNSITNVRARECPGPEWVIGRVKNLGIKILT